MFTTGHLSTEDEKRSERASQATNLQNVDVIHSMILDDLRLSAKIKGETLVISRERVGYAIHEILDMRKLAAKWVLKCFNADKKRN
jgi:hypothetical protein